MKLIVSLLLGAVVAGSAAYYVGKTTSAKQAELAAAEAMAASNAELERLKQDLAKARQNRPSPQMITVQSDDPADPQPAIVTAGSSPDAILARLVELRPGIGGQRNATLRRIIHEMEMLSDHGTAALPAIRGFLARNEDLDYSEPLPSEQADEENNEGGRGRFGGPGGGGPGAFLGGFGRGGRGDWRSGLPNTDVLAPPSLRLGLINVVREIGGEESEAVLAEVIQSTARAVELAYVLDALQELSPGKYTATAVEAAEDLLLNPVVMPNPSRLDRNAKRYLYGILEEFGDGSFASTAQALLVDAGGNVDPYALQYVNEHLGDQAMAAVYQAYMNPALTNMADRTQLAMVGLQHAGLNPQANQIFQDIVGNEELPDFARVMAVAGLAGTGFGRGRDANQPTDPAVISSRIRLLESVKGQFEDERSAAMLERTQQNLQALLEGREPEFEGRDMFRGGPGRRGGDGE